MKLKSRLRNVLQCNNVVILLNSVNREFAAESRQRLVFEKSHSSSSVLDSAYEFSKDVCKMMVSSNIPLHKVEAASFRNFLEKYTTHPIPTEYTLRKNYLVSCYEDTNNKIRNNVGKNKIWVSIDETSDADCRFVANVVVGTLKHEQPGKYSCWRVKCWKE
jgi:hypothetical protein